jgi:hypothetical protein
MKKLISIVSLSLIAVTALFAQKNLEDVLYLKNGSIIRGSITEWVPDSTLKIEIAGGSLFVFKANEIRLIAKEEKIKKEKQKTVINASSGFRFGLDGGWVVGSGDNENKSPLSIHIQGFYHFLPSSAAGIGTGLEFFNTTQAPVYLDLRQYFSQRYYAPYVFIQGGYLLPIGPQHDDVSGYASKGKASFMVNPGLGFMFPLSEKSELTISISYRYQQIKSTIDDYFKPDYVKTEKMNRINFRIGLMLH